MTAHRPYRPARPLSAALDELAQGRGLLYEQVAVDTCTDLLTSGSFEFPGFALG